MTTQGSPRPQITVKALVRDANGKPVVDGDPRALHPSIINAMSMDEFSTACLEYDERNS